MTYRLASIWLIQKLKRPENMSNLTQVWTKVYMFSMVYQEHTLRIVKPMVTFWDPSLSRVDFCMSCIIHSSPSSVTSNMYWNKTRCTMNILMVINMKNLTDDKIKYWTSYWCLFVHILLCTIYSTHCCILWT